MKLTCSFTFTPEIAELKNTGLGNVLFQIASTIGLARTNGMESVFDMSKIFKTLSHFNFNHANTIFRNISSTPLDLSSFQHIPESIYHAQIHSQDVINSIDTSKDICIDGYLESFLYFENIKDDILNLFSIDENTMNKFQTEHSFLFSKEYTTISIHVRHHYGSIRYSNVFFNEAMNYFENKYDNCRFVVFSNDIELTKSMFDRENIVYIHSFHDYEDMWLMSLCQHNIICHSTLSWWGAYLNINPKKEVVYPEEGLRIYIGQLHGSLMNVERRDQHYLPRWKSISCPTFE